MKHHDLKLHTSCFQDVVDCVKRAETRYNDRDYAVGDTLTFKEGVSEDGDFIYTGRSVSAKINHINTLGMQEGWMCLSLAKVGILIIKDGEDDA
mgnify:CR=1 FL=1|tara:strand:- start:1354 stop:1635 length:282 start_codon:yes stop_codon:yes gene_type:complete